MFGGVALALRNCFDGGCEGLLPEACLQAVDRLGKADFVPWVLSHIGQFGQLSKQRRYETADYLGSYVKPLPVHPTQEST